MDRKMEADANKTAEIKKHNTKEERKDEFKKTEIMEHLSKTLENENERSKVRGYR